MKSFLVGLGVILIGLAIFGYGRGWGADWKWYASHYDAIGYYDAENLIHPSKDVVRVWEKVVYTEKGVTDAVRKSPAKYKTPPSFAIALEEINCSERKIRILYRNEYSADGSVLISDSNPNPEWSFIRPDSVAEMLYKAVCQ